MRVRARLCTTVVVSLAKVFLAGASWQAAGLVSDAAGVGGEHTAPPFQTTLAFSVYTGAGDMCGVFVGALLLECLSPRATLIADAEDRRGRWPHFFKSTAPLLFGSFLSGSIWQGVVDGCYDAQMNFDIAMLSVALLCGLVFFMGMTTGRAILQLPRDTFRDCTLSIACGCGSAFFIGTDMRYQGNWLQVFVGERTGKDALDVFKAALSTFLGFNFGMIFLMLLVPEGLCWTDDEPAVEECVKSRESAPRHAAQSTQEGYSILGV